MSAGSSRSEVATAKKARRKGAPRNLRYCEYVTVVCRPLGTRCQRVLCWPNFRIARKQVPWRAFLAGWTVCCRTDKGRRIQSGDIRAPAAAHVAGFDNEEIELIRSVVSRNIEIRLGTSPRVTNRCPHAELASPSSPVHEPQTCDLDGAV